MAENKDLTFADVIDFINTKDNGIFGIMVAETIGEIAYEHKELEENQQKFNDSQDTIKLPIIESTYEDIWNEAFTEMSSWPVYNNFKDEKVSS